MSTLLTLMLQPCRRMATNMSGVIFGGHKILDTTELQQICFCFRPAMFEVVVFNYVSACQQQQQQQRQHTLTAWECLLHHACSNHKQRMLLNHVATWLRQLALKVFGYKKGELEGKNVSILMPNPFSQRHNSYLRNYITTGKPPLQRHMC
jgi:hypothetical protein